MARTKIEHNTVLDVERVKTFLKKNNHSWVWLSDKLGVHPNTIQAYFYKGTIPSLEKALNLSKITGIPVSELLIKKEDGKNE